MVALCVVVANTVGVSHGHEGVVSLGDLILEQVANIALVQVVVETSLHIGDFLLGDRVFVVVGGLVDEALVEEGLEENVEVAHEAGVVAELVLREDSDQAVVTLITNFVRLLNCGKAEGELDNGEVRQAEDHDRNTVLHITKFNKEWITIVINA